MQPIAFERMLMRFECAMQRSLIESQGALLLFLLTFCATYNEFKECHMAGLHIWLLVNHPHRQAASLSPLQLQATSGHP